MLFHFIWHCVLGQMPLTSTTPRAGVEHQTTGLSDKCLYSYSHRVLCWWNIIQNCIAANAFHRHVEFTIRWTCSRSPEHYLFSRKCKINARASFTIYHSQHPVDCAELTFPRCIVLCKCCKSFCHLYLSYSLASTFPFIALHVLPTHFLSEAFGNVVC